MQGFKRVAVVATIIGLAFTISACRRHHEEPLKLGYVDAPVAEQVVRLG